MQQTPTQPIRFLPTDNSDTLVRKLTAQSEQSESRFALLQRELNELRTAKRPVMYREKSGRIQLDGLGTREGHLQRDRNGSVRSVQPLRVGEWYNYFYDSTVIGWSAFTAEMIYYCRVGSLLFVEFHIAGTSNNVATSFTLPYALRDLDTIFVPIRVENNGVVQIQCGMVMMTVASNLVTLYPNAAGAPWAAANGKSVKGEFFFRMHI